MFRHRSLALCLTVGLFTVFAFHAAALTARSDDDTPVLPAAPGGSEPSDEDLFNKLDISEDGFLSGKEVKDFLRFDLDGNKRVTLKEFLTGRAKERTPVKPRLNVDKLFNSLDMNQDGVLSGKEAKKFKQFDTDGDGEISKAEFAAGLSREQSGGGGDSIAPAKLQTYRNLKEKLSARHVKYYIPFRFSFAPGWAYDARAGTEKSSNMVKVERNADLGKGVSFTQENFAVGFFESPANANGILLQALLQQLCDQLGRQIQTGFPKCKINAKQEMKFGAYPGYGFDFTFQLEHPTKGELDSWGRVILISGDTLKQKSGLVIIMLATSEAPELKSLEDLGVKGELPLIIKSFQVGDETATTPPPDFAAPPAAPAPPAPPAPPRTE